MCNKIFELTPKEGGRFERTWGGKTWGRGRSYNAMAFGPHGSSQGSYTTYANSREVRPRTYVQGADRVTPTPP